MGNIFSWLQLALQVKVGKVASFVGKIFVVRHPTTKTTNILPHENYTLYGSAVCQGETSMSHIRVSYRIFSQGGK